VLLLTAFPLWLVFPTGSIFRYGVLPGVTRAQSRQALSAAFPHYYVLAELNRRVQPADRTYTLFCEEYKYYVRTPSAGDWYGEHSYAWLASGLSSAADIPARLRLPVSAGW